MPSIDIFDSDIRLPPRVCILAPGPKGSPFHDQIPDDCGVIAVSKAVLIPGVQAGIWMMNHADQDWFEAANTAFQGMRVFRDEAVIEAQAVLGGDLPCYSYRALRGALGLRGFNTADRVIRSGGSVSGCALQFAYNFGAREILLCGIDMSGDSYWDGTANVQPQHGETWNVVQYLDPLIQWMTEDRGIKIATLSPTKLAVPGYPIPERVYDQPV